MNPHQELERSILSRILQNIDPDAAAIISKNGQEILARHGFETADHEPKWSIVERSIESGGPISETNLTHSILCMPFKGGNEEIKGLMYVELHRPRRLKHRDLAILQELRRRVEKKFPPGSPVGARALTMRKLVEARRSANSTLSIVTRVLKPERAVVLVEIDGHPRVLASHGLPHEDSLNDAEVSARLLDHLWERKTPLYLVDAQRELDQEEFPEVTDFKIRSVAACPMVGNDGLCRGLVYIDSRNVPSRFTDPQLSILVRFADSLRNDLQWLISPDSSARESGKFDTTQVTQEAASRRNTSVPPFARRTTPADPVAAPQTELHAQESADLEDSFEDDVITIEVSMEEEHPSMELEAVPEPTQEDEIPAVSTSTETAHRPTTPTDTTIEVSPEKAALLRELLFEKEQESQSVESLEPAPQEPSLLSLKPADLDEPPLFGLDSFESAVKAVGWASFERDGLPSPAPHEIQTIETEVALLEPEEAVDEHSLEVDDSSVEPVEDWLAAEPTLSPDSVPDFKEEAPENVEPVEEPSEDPVIAEEPPVEPEPVAVEPTEEATLVAEPTEEPDVEVVEDLFEEPIKEQVEALTSHESQDDEVDPIGEPSQDIEPLEEPAEDQEIAEEPPVEPEPVTAEPMEEPTLTIEAPIRSLASSELLGLNSLSLAPAGEQKLPAWQPKKIGFWRRLFQAVWPWSKKQGEGFHDLTLLSVQGKIVLEGEPKPDGRTTVTLRFGNPNTTVVLDLGERGGKYHYDICLRKGEQPTFSLLAQRQGYHQVKLSNATIKVNERGYFAEISEISLMPDDG